MPGGPLVVVYPGALVADGERVLVPAKTVEGLQAYAERWPGDVVLLAPPADAREPGPAAPPGEVWLDPPALGFEVVTTADARGELVRRGTEVALIPLALEYLPLLGAARRTVAIAEHTGSSRLAMARVDLGRGPDRWRAEVGFRRLGRRLVRMAAMLDGVQCNGPVAWKAYRGVSRSAVRFYDSRLRLATIDEAQASREGRVPDPLRLGFSGRLIAIKGPEYAARLVLELRRRGHDARLTVFGDGPLRSALARDLGDHATFAGTVDFQTQWCARVPHEVDLMVLPHVQSDPSGTYLESAGTGTPVLGFDNQALQSLVAEGGIGWTVPRGDVGALAEVVTRLVDEPSELEAASARAVRFMRTHAMEPDFDRRVAHLREVAGPTASDAPDHTDWVPGRSGSD